jgi:polar amino acid transport system substrate-binding protein
MTGTQLSRLAAALACGLWLAGVTSMAAVAESQTPDSLKNSFQGRDDLVNQGRSLFNQYCSHCHGPNAIQGERAVDLRRLVLRYGGEAPRTFYETVQNGRPEKGMPSWKGVLADDFLWKIFTFLETIQK